MIATEPIATEGTLAQMFAARVAQTPDAVAYIEYSRTLGKWFEHSWQTMQHHAAQTQTLLQNAGLERGDRIGIMARASTYWVGLDMAAAGLGLITVPLYYHDHGSNVASIAQRCRMRALFIGGPDQWQQLADHRADMPELQHLYSAVEIADTEVRSFNAELAEVSAEPFRIDATDPQGLATIVFTSGTTGPPKGVQLSHANILSNVAACMKAVPLSEDDSLLSFLPLSHMFERTVGYYVPMLSGAWVAFARSVHTLREDLQLQPPTVLVSVPRIYEKIYEKVLMNPALATGVGRILMSLARRVGGSGRYSPWKIFGPLTRGILGRRIMRGIGGRMRLAITGGAPLNPRVGKFFAGIGLKVLQGYGLTETSPVVSVNRADDMRCDTVGPPIDGVEVQLSTEGKLRVRGTGIMQGYLDDPQATQEVLDEAGWFDTGDLAQWEDGHIRIVGRAKEIIVLSTGEKMPPATLEEALCADPRISQAWVAGEGHKFLSAVVVAKPGTTEAELLAVMPKLLDGLPAWATIKRVHVEEEPWTAENEILTSTLKLRRSLLEKKYADVIAAFYA